MGGITSRRGHDDGAFGGWYYQDSHKACDNYQHIINSKTSNGWPDYPFSTEQINPRYPRVLHGVEVVWEGMLLWLALMVLWFYCGFEEQNGF